MSTGDPNPYVCEHGVDRRMQRCYLCQPDTSGLHYQIPYAAGHCGKCGAPYTIDTLSGLPETKFKPSCRCWNNDRDDHG